MASGTRSPSVIFAANCTNNESRTDKKFRLAIRTDLSTLKSESDYPFEPTSAVDLESCRGRQFDESIEQDIHEYEAQEKEFRLKNKWSMFPMLYLFRCHSDC
jgi:hypothetical protein